MSELANKYKFEIGKFYKFKYLYKRNICYSEGVFIKEEFGFLYFNNNDDWTIILPKSIKHIL